MNPANNRHLDHNRQKQENQSLRAVEAQQQKHPAAVGRQIFLKEIYEYQNYLPFSGEKEIERVEDIKKFITVMNGITSAQAKRIPEVPEILTVGYMAEHLDKSKPYRIIAGMDFDTVDSFILDLFKLGYMAISGKEKSGKTNFVRYFINCFETDVTEMPAEAYIYDGYDRQLSALKQSPITQKYAVSLDGIEEMMTSIEAECQKRKELIAASGISAVEKLPAQLVVIQHPVFFEPDGITKACAELFKKVIKAAREAKTFIIFSNVENIPVAYGAPELLKMIKDKNNILYFDDLKSCKLAEISLAESKKHKKVTEVGDAFFITERSINRIKTPLFHPTKVSSGQPVV